MWQYVKIWLLSLLSSPIECLATSTNLHPSWNFLCSLYILCNYRCVKCKVNTENSSHLLAKYCASHAKKVSRRNDHYIFQYFISLMNIFSFNSMHVCWLVGILIRQIPRCNQEHACSCCPQINQLTARKKQKKHGHVVRTKKSDIFPFSTDGNKRRKLSSHQLFHATYCSSLKMHPKRVYYIVNCNGLVAE